MSTLSFATSTRPVASLCCSQLLHMRIESAYQSIHHPWYRLLDSVSSLTRTSVFVNGRPRPVIMENMRSRIDRADIKAERQEAIQAMCDIALDRAKKLQA